MGMGMVGRIIKVIFNNIDYRMVQALFRDPVFELILEVQQCKKFHYIVLKDIEFPRLWSDKLRIRSIVPMAEAITIKIHIIHRISFYRENILDLTKESYLEQLLVMTQNEFSKDIIVYITKELILEELIKLDYETALEKQLLPKEGEE